MARCFQTPILWKNDPSLGKGSREAAGATSIFGETIDELIAPYDGVVVGSHTPPVIQPRDWGLPLRQAVIRLHSRGDIN